MKKSRLEFQQWCHMSTLGFFADLSLTGLNTQLIIQWYSMIVILNGENRKGWGFRGMNTSW